MSISIKERKNSVFRLISYYWVFIPCILRLFTKLYKVNVLTVEPIKSLTSCVFDGLDLSSYNAWKLSFKQIQRF